MNDLRPLATVRPLAAVQPLQDVTGLQDVAPLTFNKQYYRSYKPKLFSVDDTGEKANSLLDVLLGPDQRNVLLDEEGLSWSKDIPVLRLVTGTTALLKDKYADPVVDAVKGDITFGQAAKEIGLNTLIEVSEDLDILSNIVKSQIIGSEHGFGSLEALGNSLGINGKRTVYNYNTGNTVADIILEVMSDPLTMFEFGASIATAAGKAGVKGATAGATKAAVNELSEQAVKDYAKAVTKTVAKEGRESTFENILKNVNRRSLKEISEAGLKEATPEIIDTAVKSKGYKAFTAASKLKAGADTIDSAITKVAWSATPVGLPAKYVVKPLLKSTFDALYNRIITNLKNYDLSKNFVKKQGIYKELLQDTIYRNNAINETIFKNNARFFRQMGIDETTLQQEFYKMISKMRNVDEATDLTEAFIEYLTKNNDRFRALLNIDNKFADYIASSDFVQLIEATSAAPLAIHKAEQELSSRYHQATLNSMRKYIDKNKNNLEETYKYIDETVLNYNGKHFGLSNLDDFLKEIMLERNTSREYLDQVATLLESLGINRDNAHNIDKILKSRVKDKGLAIRKLLDTTNTGTKLLTSADYAKLMNKTLNRINDTTGTALNKFWKEDIATHNVSKYKETVKNSIKNVKDAAQRIQNDVDVQHAISYIQNVVRLEDIPEWKNTMDLIETALKEQPNLLDPSVTGITREYIDDIEKFLKDTTNIMRKLDTDTSVAFDIPAWYASLDNVQKELDKVQKAFTNYGGPYAVAPRDKIYRLQQALETFTAPKVTDALVNYIDNINGMVQVQLSHLGMFSVLTQHTHLSNDPQLKTFLEQMSMKDSVLRTRIIPDIVNKFNDAGLYAQAANINKVIAQIDTVQNLNILLTTDIPTSFKLSNKTQQDLKTILYDVIENNSSMTIADIYSKPVTSHSDWIKSGLGQEEYIAQATSQYETLLQQIDYRVAHTQTVLNRIAKDTPTLNQADVIQEITEQLHNMLDTYINAQAKIKNVDNIALCSLYSLDTIEALDLTAKIRFALARNTDISIEVLNEYDTLMRDFQKFAEGIQLGVDEIQKINEGIATPLQAKEATEMLRSISESYNLFSGSVESTMFTTKYMVSKDFVNTFKLQASDIIGSNQEYLMVAERLNWYKDVLHEEYKYSDEYISKLREALVQTYSEPNAIFAPANPAMYFKSLDAEPLLAWECVTKGNLSIRNKTNFYTALSQLTHKADFAKYEQSDILGRLETIMRNRGFVDDNALIEAAIIARNSNAMEYANRIIDANLMYTLHSLDDLGKYKDDIVKLLQDNVQDQDYITRTIIDIEEDTAIRMSYTDFGNPDDLHKVTRASYGYKDTYFGSQEMMYAERSAAKAMSIAEMNAEELATHLYRQTPGGLVFYNQNIIRTLNPDGSVTWSGVDNLFNFTEDELKAAGLKIKQDGDWFYVRLTDNRVHNAPLKYRDLATNYSVTQQRYTDLIERYRAYLNMYEIDDVPSNIITVETLNEDTWNKFLDAHSDFFGDAEERKLYQKLTKQGNSSFFDKSYSRLNLTVVGGYDSYNIWNNLYSTDFITRSTQMSRNTLGGLTAAINRSNKINKYLSMFFNNDYALDSPLLKTMFSEASDEQIAAFFAEGKYRVAILRSDKQGLPKVFEYTVTNRRSLDKATAAGGILVPKETYNAIRSVVNDRKMTNSLLDVYRRVVPTTYKSMYLFTAGFPFRNAIDSLIYKNGTELGGITALPKVFKYEREASKALELHNKIQQEVLDLTGGETFNKEVLLEVLSKHTADEADVYYLTDLFIESGASGSLSQSMGDYLEAFNKKGTDDIRSMWEAFYEDKVLFGKQALNPLYRLRELNDHIEQTARMGLFLASVDEGLPVGEAIERVIRTHFDYSGGSDLLQICERIFWFSTFPINNFNYYVNGGLTKSPSMIKLVMDTQTASWNNGEYTYEELKKTNFLSYHALTGNIRIGNWIIKTSPSLFDFISLVTDIPGNISDRLNPFMSVAVGNTELENAGEELNPLITQFRNWSKFKQGNIAPSILAQIGDRDWSNSMYKWRNHYQRSNWTAYPRIKRPTAQIRYLRKYYSRRYNTNPRRMTRTSLYHDAVNYYKLYKRGVQYRYL